MCDGRQKYKKWLTETLVCDGINMGKYWSTLCRARLDRLKIFRLPSICEFSLAWFGSHGGQDMIDMDMKSVDRSSYERDKGWSLELSNIVAAIESSLNKSDWEELVASRFFPSRDCNQGRDRGGGGTS